MIRECVQKFVRVQESGEVPYTVQALNRGRGELEQGERSGGEELQVKIAYD